jgi:hypothetical protein
LPEELSNGRLSRRFCNKILKYLCMVGSVARISNNSIIGSDIEHADRYRWGIAWDMVGDVPMWMDPFNWGTTFCSKDYTQHELKQGENCFDFFGIKQTAVKVMLHDPGKPIKPSRYQSLEDSDSPETEKNSSQETGTVTFNDIEKLHSQPASYINELVFKRWIIGDVDHGVCKGIVKSYDSTRTGPTDRPRVCDGV